MNSNANPISVDIDMLQSHIAGKIAVANAKWAEAQRVLEQNNPWQAGQLKEKSLGKWTSKLTTRR